MELVPLSLKPQLSASFLKVPSSSCCTRLLFSRRDHFAGRCRIAWRAQACGLGSEPSRPSLPFPKLPAPLRSMTLGYHTCPHCNDLLHVLSFMRGSRMWFTFSLLTPIMFVDDPKSTDVPPNPVSLSLPLYDLPQSCLSLPLSDAETQPPRILHSHGHDLYLGIMNNRLTS